MLPVSNTSPISNLAFIGRLNLLHEQFRDRIPPAVETELLNIPDAAARKTIDQIQQAGWLKSRPVSDSNLVSLLTVDLHQGSLRRLRGKVAWSGDLDTSRLERQAK